LTRLNLIEPIEGEVTMAAWVHSAQKRWNEVHYYEYRKIVANKAASYRGRSEDCADLSMMLLIRYAAKEGLPVTFEDNAGKKYRSTDDYIHFGGVNPTDLYIAIVHDKIGVEALWKRNTVVNPTGPTAGDLLIRWSSKTFTMGKIKVEVEDNHHAALVIRHYNIGVSHPLEKDKMPDFPGAESAEDMLNLNKTQYFRGTTDKNGVTVSRRPDRDVHFDFLNSRSSAKRNAEVIYFANARQLQEEGYQFRMYSNNVLSG
jgi:hypothetical protein